MACDVAGGGQASLRAIDGLELVCLAFHTTARITNTKSKETSADNLQMVCGRALKAPRRTGDCPSESSRNPAFDLCWSHAASVGTHNPQGPRSREGIENPPTSYHALESLSCWPRIQHTVFSNHTSASINESISLCKAIQGST